LNGRFGEARQAAKGRLGTVTNGSFRESEFNVSFPAINLMSGRSTHDPNPSIEFLQTDQSANTDYSNCWTIKQTLVTSTYRPKPAAEDAGEIFHS
jgi:hypothetical protein